MLARLVWPALSSPLIAVLHCVSRPPAVVWAVLAVVVNTINGEPSTITMLERPGAEDLEVIAPFIANEDATCTVVLELLD